VLYYIAPQLWASREGRMKKLRADVDCVASIFPFEASYYQSHGVNATYVGHPLFDELPANRVLPQPRDFGESPVIGIIPGSRRSEVKANLPHLIEVMNAIVAAFPEASFLIPTTSASHELVKQMLLGRADVAIQQDGFDDLIPRCDLVITKSGTSTVHVAAWRVPMIVVYRINPILWHLAARWLIKTKKIAMVNILAGQIDLVPEFIPWYGSNRGVIDCALDLLQHPDKLRAQHEKLEQLMKTIDQPGASMNTAKLAMSLMSSAANTQIGHSS
jgi:lipid-A-disaccharide synthase